MSSKRKEVFIMATKKVKGSLLWSFCEDLVKKGAGYVWGGRGKKYDTTERDYLYKSFKSNTYNYKYYFVTQWKRWKNKIVTDCSCLIQAFRAKYVDNVDMTADGLYNSCPKDKRGTIDTLPKNMQGILIFTKNTNNSRMGHVGVYGGNDETIEAMNDEKGIVRSKFSKRWTHWGIPDWLEPTIIVPPATTVTPSKTPVDTNKNYTKKHKVTAYHLNVRNKPTSKDSKIIKVIDKGTIVKEFGRNGKWIKIDPDAELWTSGDYLQCIERKHKVTAYHLNVRNKPTSKDNKPVKVIDRDSIVTEYSRTGKWAKISATEELYVSLDYLKEL
jgi:cell wall-associated NlpC family hydrolase